MGNDNYELEEITPETLKIMGHMESESDAAKPAKIKVKFKIILKDNCVSLLGMAITEWDDPSRDTQLSFKIILNFTLILACSAASLSLSLCPIIFKVSGVISSNS